MSDKYTKKLSYKQVKYLIISYLNLKQIGYYFNAFALHFNPDFDNENTPKQVSEFRELILKSDGIIICTLEYVFSLPGTLKNAIEWCVSTTVFSQKPIGLITASASGIKGHEELKLLMKTLETKFTENSTLLIQGIKGKFNDQGELTDNETIESLCKFIKAFDKQINE